MIIVDNYITVVHRLIKYVIILYCRVYHECKNLQVYLFTRFLYQKKIHKMDVASLDPWQNLGTICMPWSCLFTFRSNIFGVNWSHNCHHATILLQLIELLLKHVGILKKISPDQIFCWWFNFDWWFCFDITSISFQFLKSSLRNCANNLTITCQASGTLTWGSIFSSSHIFWKRTISENLVGVRSIRSKSYSGYNCISITKLVGRLAQYSFSVPNSICARKLAFFPHNHTNFESGMHQQDEHPNVSSSKAGRTPTVPCMWNMQNTDSRNTVDGFQTHAFSY